MKLPNAPFSAGSHGGFAAIPAEAGPVPAVADADAQATQPLNDKHVDYDRHPLKVAGLEHYIEPPVGEERFRIS